MFRRRFVWSVCFFLYPLFSCFGVVRVLVCCLSCFGVVSCLRERGVAWSQRCWSAAICELPVGCGRLRIECWRCWRLRLTVGWFVEPYVLLSVFMWGFWSGTGRIGHLQFYRGKLYNGRATPTSMPASLSKGLLARARKRRKDHTKACAHE